MSLSIPANSLQPHLRSTFVFTEWLVFLALLFTFVIAIAQIGYFSLQQTFLKHLVGIGLLGACSLDYIGHRLFRHKGVSQTINTTPYWISLALLGAYAVCGSLYARFELDVADTFFINGFYIFMGVWFALTLRHDNLDRILKATFWLTLGSSIVVCISTMSARIADLYVNDTSMHEREFFVIPLLFIVLFSNLLRGWLRIGIALLIVGATVAAHKNTPTLVFGLTLLMIAWRWWISGARIDRDTLKRLVFIYSSLVLVVGAAIGYLTYSYFMGGATPQGNIDFRQHQYSIAWNEFLSSPVIGSAFTIPTGIYFNLWFDPRFGYAALPTHNDLLDLLRAGGIVAFVLWLIPVGLLVSRAFGVLRQASAKHAWGGQQDMIAWLLLVNIAAIIVYLFNPLLSKTAYAALVWVYFALLAAAVTRLRSTLEHER